ncbi:MAG: TIGR04372 family glycosyltransferase [Magnetococcales bacterium]|nr:TIGR04372 family glycosyltransferase [Magnetococcales bacterium]
MSTKPRAYYSFFQIGRIGEIAQRIAKVRNLHPEHACELILLLPHEKNPGDCANPAVLEVLCRGLQIIRVAGSQEAEQLYLQAKAEDPRTIWVDPEPMTTYIDFLNRFHDQPRQYIATLTREEVEKGWKIREKLGMPRNARIVTFHVREAGYLGNMEYHNFRNAHIANYYYALVYLLKKGYWVVRFGDRTMQPLKNLPEHFIDAPFHPEYEPFFEPYFIACSDFYFGMPSGPSTVAEAFGVPQLMTNYPLSCGSNENDGDLFVYKKYYSHSLGRMLTYEEILTSPILDFHRLYLYEESEISVIENSPTEIFAAAWEMESRLTRTYPFEEEAAATHQRVKEIQKKAHLLRQQTVTGEYYPSYPFYSGYLQLGQVSHEFIRLNPGYLGHRFPRIQWGFHPRVEGLPGGIEEFYRERLQFQKNP